MGVAAAVAEAFFYTFSMAIDTILMSFCYDVHANGVAKHNLALRKGASTFASLHIGGVDVGSALSPAYGRSRSGAADCTPPRQPRAHTPAPPLPSLSPCTVTFIRSAA